MTNAQDVIVRYLQDAIAAEKSCESHLRGFAKEGNHLRAQAIFAQHAEETRRQRRDLEERLHLLNASPSAVKGIFTSLFGTAPKTTLVGQDEAGKAAHNLMVAFAVENSEIAMYEALAIAAHEAGDAETEALARRIQQEERLTAERVFAILPVVAEQTFRDGCRELTAGS